MIHCHFVGRLTRNAELKEIKSANSEHVLRFTVATDHGFGDKRVALYVNCALFGKRASALVNHLTKGAQIAVHGELFTNDYVGKDGTNKTTLECRVNEVDLCSKPKIDEPNQENAAPAYQTSPPSNGASFDDSIPF